MIPKTIADTVVDVDIEQLRTIDVGSVLDGIACIHHYDPGFYGASSWDRAASCLSYEVEQLHMIDEKTDTRDDFDELAFECETGDLEIRLELGVWSLAETLCAAGCPTFSSCRSHREGNVPFVLFAADAPRVPLLEEAARTAGCGLEMDNGLLVAWGPSLREVLSLAREILGRREAFDAMSPLVPREACVAPEHW